MFYFNSIFLFLTLCVANTSANTQEQFNIYTPTQTVDNINVDFIPLSQDEISESFQSVAFAKYDKSGAYVFYDYELFAKLSLFPKFLIIEHERAHHILGHSLSTKKHRESKTLIPGALTYRKEKDADCFAGYRAAKVFPDKSTADISSALTEVYRAMGGSGPEIPSWVRNRINTIVTCFEGELLPHPEPL